MFKRRTLLSKLATCPLITVAGPWVRGVQYRYLTAPPPGALPGTGPKPLWPGGSKLTGQRFTPKGGFDTAYLACDPYTAMAEVQMALLGPTGASLRPSPPMVFLTITGVVLNVLDATDPTIQSRLGTSLPELTGAWAYVPGGGMAPTQLLGSAAHNSKRIHAILYHSTKNMHANGLCIAVFPDRLNPTHESLVVHDPSGLLVDRLP